MRLVSAAAATLIFAMVVSLQAQGPAYFIRGIDDPRQRRESRAEVLDTPVLPGSIVKTVALVAALDRGVITANSSHLCRRVVKADGQTFTCSHLDLRRPLSPAEALAYSCNDFFVSLAPRLPREALNATRVAAGLPPISSDTPMASAIVGLAGPKTTPRALVDVLARLTAVGKDKPVPMRPATRAVLFDGLRGAADYGTASAFHDADTSALAKTGTVLMPGGAALGLVVALAPAEKPSTGIVVAVPGGSGMDAAAFAAKTVADGTGRTLHSGSDPNVNTMLRSGSDPNVNSVRLGRTEPNGRTRVENIAIDAYIAQVLAGEGQPRAGDAAQQALAITARTFALANRNRHRKEGFDLCDTTHCQVLRPATPTTRRAAEATSGRVLLHRGQPAFVFYSAWCGGRSELASQVWPGATDYSYEPALHDEACQDEPGWESEVRAGAIEEALRQAGHKGSRLRSLRILTRNTSDRVVRIGVEGFSPGDMSGDDFRMAVGRVAGYQSIKSTNFRMVRTSAGYRFTGRGFGHGVGLCVVGAGRRAERGASVDQILKFYFPGLTVGSIGGVASTTAASVPAPAPPPPVPSMAANIALALPGTEEAERAVLLALIQKSRDEIATATGAATPARLRVTVHPTVESFGRATGQPWWMSGASDGATIDLLPITVLRQQGQLERTIRHEIAHVLLDAALAKRPMWVREGAAAYYARPASARASAADRVACPSDAELTRALSAGAQRDAYARAEACFARAIGEGKKWDQVR